MPPKLINVNGIPVTGINPETTAILIKAWIQISNVNPKANKSIIEMIVAIW